MSAKKKHAVPKNGSVWKVSAEEATLAQMPHFNAHACGTGAHGDTKYNRARQKRAWQREIDREGACNRRPLSFMHWGKAWRELAGRGVGGPLSAEQEPCAYETASFAALEHSGHEGNGIGF